MLEIVSCREREAQTLKGALEDADLHGRMRLFLEEVLGRYPDEKQLERSLRPLEGALRAQTALLGPWG